MIKFMFSFNKFNCKDLILYVILIKMFIKSILLFCIFKKIQLIKCNINKIIYKIYLNRYFIKKICIFRRNINNLVCKNKKNLFNINKIIYKKN